MWSRVRVGTPATTDRTKPMNHCFNANLKGEKHYHYHSIGIKWKEVGVFLHTWNFRNYIATLVFSEKEIRHCLR